MKIRLSQKPGFGLRIFSGNFLTSRPKMHVQANYFSNYIFVSVPFNLATNIQVYYG